MAESNPSKTDKADQPDTKPDRQVLTELVRRILYVVDPLRIILFGSAARGTMSPHSDLDILVVMPDGVHRRRTAQAVHRHLLGIGVAKNIIVVTENDIREYGDNPSPFLSPALKEGKELYHAA